MAINERLIDTEVAAAGNGGGGTGNQEEGLMLHLDANDVDSYDGDGSIWYDIKDHEYTTSIDIDSNFKVLNWDGNGTSQNLTTGFKADFFFAACTTVSSTKIVQDSVRGLSQYWEAAPGDSNDFQTATNFVTSFNSDSISIGNGTEVNFNARNFRGLALKAGDTEEVNNDGTQTTTVSVNTDIGFSIVKGTGRLYDQTFGHGLGEKPKLVILKQDGQTQALMHHDEAGGYFEMNNSNYSSSSSTPVNTNLVSSFSGYSLSVADTTLYCFAERRGFSKFGTYTGTGASANKVYCGFEPAFVIVRKLASGSSNGFFMFDNLVNPTNPRTKYQHFALSGTLVTDSAGIDFNGDGFTINSTNTVLNGSGSKFMFIAFAKNTNETSLIPDTDLELHLDPTSYSGSGTTWTADVGSNGTLVGNTSYDEELGDWFDLDGSGDYVTTSYNINPINDYTFEGWFNQDVAEGVIVWGMNDGLTSRQIYGGFESDGDVRLGADGGSSHLISTSQPLTVGKWHHIVWVYNPSNNIRKIYVDGGLVASSTSSWNRQSATRAIWIGTRNTGGSPAGDFDGKIGQFRIYDSILTQDQVRQNFNFTKPSYPNGFDGTITSATWNFGGYFDVSSASNSGIEIEELTTQITPNGNDSTMGGWFRKDNTNWGTFWSKGYSTNYELQAAEGGGNNLRYIFYRKSGSMVADAGTNSSLSANTWYHIMGVIDWRNQDVKIYLNGSLVGTNTTWTHYTSNQYLTGSVFIGRRNDNSGNLDGKVSAFKVYDRVLDTSEITALFDDEKANYGY